VLNDTLRLLDAPKAVSAVSACLPLATLPPLTPPSKQPKPVAKAAPKLKEVSPGPASEPAPKSPAPSLEAPTGPLTWAQRAAKGAAKGAAKDAAPAPTPAPTPAPKAEAEAAAEAAPVLDPLSLYVKSLPDGEIRSVSIKEDRGYAFEDFKSPEATVAALAKGANADVTDEVSSFKETNPVRDAGGSMREGVAFAQSANHMLLQAGESAPRECFSQPNLFFCLK